MTAHFKLAAAGLILSGVLAAAGCTKPAEKADAPAASAPAASPDVTRFRIGSLEAISLRDGGLTAPNDNKILGVGKTPAEVAAVLTAAGLPGDTISLSINPLFVRDGARLVLIDTGAGSSFGPSAGKLPASLAAAEIDPNSITDVLISHTHGDHVGGLVTSDGKLAFPNAKVRMEAAEWTFMQADPQLKAIVDAIRPQVETFAPGAQITPDIKAQAIEGHTPGHTGYLIGTGADALLYAGDAMHHSVVSVQHPEWQIAFDSDAPVATRSRETLDASASSANTRLYFAHFPYPGLGRIQKQGETYVWVPEAAAN